MIAIHDIPYHMAKARNHPHQDAIHAGGWISLFTTSCTLAVSLDLGHRISTRCMAMAEGPGKNRSSRCGRIQRNLTVAALEKKIAAIEANASKSSVPQPK